MSWRIAIHSFREGFVPQKLRFGVQDGVALQYTEANSFLLRLETSSLLLFPSKKKKSSSVAGRIFFYYYSKPRYKFCSPKLEVCNTELSSVYWINYVFIRTRFKRNYYNYDYRQTIDKIDKVLSYRDKIFGTVIYDIFAVFYCIS